MSTIFTSSRKAFETEVRRLNRRADKVGLSPIVIQFVGYQTVEQERVCVTVMEGESSESSRKVPVRIAEYAVDLPSMEEYKWELAATITLVEGRPFVDAHKATFDRTPWEDRDPTQCDHCNADRNRKLTYVVRHKEDGRMMQVGRQCFADYVSPEGLKRLEFMALVYSVLHIDDDDFVFPGDGGSGKQEVMEVRRVIAVAEAIAASEGWISNQYDHMGERVREGTHRRAVDYLLSGSSPSKDAAERIAGLRDEQNPIWAQVDAAIARIREMDLAEDDEFGRSLAYCAEFDVVPTQKARLTAYLCEFLRNVDRKAAFEAKKATMQHVGTVGKRQDFLGLTCVRVASYESLQWGTSYIHTFEDVAGNQLVWRTRKQVVNEGEKVSLKATVKEHGEWRGAKQTTISRAKMV